MKKYFLMLAIATFSITAFAQKAKVETITIQTNGVCSKCKDTFAANIPYLKGVSDYSYDEKTAKMTVTYSTSKTSADAIRKAVSDLGYNADQVKANPEARAKLPACCKVESSKSGHSGCSKSCGHSH